MPSRSIKEVPISNYFHRLIIAVIVGLAQYARLLGAELNCTHKNGQEEKQESKKQDKSGF